jgi:hypothetical protein
MNDEDVDVEKRISREVLGRAKAVVVVVVRRMLFCNTLGAVASDV